MTTYSKSAIAIIKESSLVVDKHGNLCAVTIHNGLKYEYPIDGLSDRLIEIKPYQNAGYGMVYYTKTVCEDTEDANRNDGTESGGSSESSTDSNDELDELDALDFEKMEINLDTIADGCLSTPTFAMVVILIILLGIITK